jgi:kumamolisin
MAATILKSGPFAGLPANDTFVRAAARQSPIIYRLPAVGNASENSGYLQVIDGQAPQSVGGTSAVAPLYAGLMARINANNRFAAGYLNTMLYKLPASAFHDIVGAPGPANNNLGQVKGYPAGTGWDASTGLGSVDGQALQDALAAT